MIDQYIKAILFDKYIYQLCMKSCFVFSFFSVVQNIADSRPKVRYLVAKDDANNTLEEIVKVTIILNSYCVKLNEKS